MWSSCTDKGEEHHWGRNYAGRMSCMRCGVVGKRLDNIIEPMICPECGKETNIVERKSAPPKPLKCSACLINATYDVP